MATAAATDFGTDVDARSGVPLRWGLASGRKNLSNALARRFITVRGSLPGDTAYGLDLRDYLNAALTTAGLSQLRSAISAQALLDPRVQSVDDVVFAPNLATNSLTIGMLITDAQGPFELVLSIDRVTVTILDTGQLPPVAAAGTAPTTITGTGSDGAPGPAGSPGPAGPQGPAGSGSGGIELSVPQIFGSTAGSEELVSQLTVDLSSLSGSTLTVDLAGRGKTASGTATFKLYIGGTYDTIDGTLIGSTTTTSATFAAIQISGTTANPTGLRPIKVTITSPGFGIDAQIRDFTVSVN